jgi:hypothetical protein
VLYLCGRIQTSWREPPVCVVQQLRGLLVGSLLGPVWALRGFGRGTRYVYCVLLDTRPMLSFAALHKLFIGVWPGRLPFEAWSEAFHERLVALPHSSRPPVLHAANSAAHVMQLGAAYRPVGECTCIDGV